MNLYLDDLRTTPEGFERVYSYEEFVAYLQHYGLPDFISFDHDLGEEFSVSEMAGYDCAKYLVEYCIAHQLPLPDYKVHSQNPVGKANIEQLLANFKKNIEF
mgnify:CR=1 FL=1